MSSTMDLHLKVFIYSTSNKFYLLIKKKMSDKSPYLANYYNIGKP